MSVHLRVLTGDGLLHEAQTFVVPSLDSQPVRPGEMPESLVVELSAEASDRTTEEIARTGVPASLWVRLAVEAARHVRAVAAGGRMNREKIILSLDEAAADSAVPLIAFESRRQREYARLLRVAAPAPRHGPPAPIRRVDVAVPDAILAGWALEAARALVGLSEFVSARVVEAPRECAQWEAAAAEEGRGLGEWIYAKVLALTAR